VGRVLKLEPKCYSATPCKRVPSISTRKRSVGSSPLTAELKDFIDRVIVPILAKEYLAASDPEIQLANDDSDAAHSVAATRPHRS
jgi:hypothetical protein